MHRTHLLVTVALILGLLAALSARVAGAAPLKSPKASVIDLSCAPNDYGIDSVTAVVMDNDGAWSPGHAIAINGEPANLIGIPLNFHVTLTDATGMVVESFDEVKPGKRNGVTNTLQCTQTESFTDEEGNDLTVDTTVTLFIPGMK